MRILKNIFSQLHTFILIALLSTVFWLWIFTFTTDTAAEKKITVFFDLPAFDEKALDLELEKNMPDGIKMIRVHTFDYAMFDDGSLQGGDIFVVRASNMEKYLPDLAPIPAGVIRKDEFTGEGDRYYAQADGGSAVKLCYGVRVYDASTGEGIVPRFVNYIFPDGTREDCYLCFGAKSLHFAANDGAADDAAVTVAGNMLRIP